MDTEPITTEAGDNDIGAGSDAELGAIYDAHNSETAESSAESDADTSIGRAPRTQPKTSEPQKFATGVDAPQAWAADKRGLWNALSTEARHYITQREQEAHTRITEMGRQLSELQNAGHQAKNGTGSDVLAAYEQHRQAGVVPRHNDGRELRPNEIIEGALSLDRALRSDPASVIAQLAQAHGVDLSGFGGPQVDPNQIRQQVAAEYQAHYQQAIAQQQAQQRAQREQYLTAEISRFADGKDYWDKVQPEIERQIHGLKATDAARVEQDPLWALTEAHDRAVKQAGILTKEVAAERKRKADEAKRLASLNARSNGGQSPITASRNIWDNASWGAIYDRVNAGDR